MALAYPYLFIVLAVFRSLSPPYTTSPNNTRVSVEWWILLDGKDTNVWSILLCPRTRGKVRFVTLEQTLINKMRSLLLLAPSPSAS